MPNVKEIRTKINSIKSTQKITRAMEMVAASKMRKSQDRMLASRPYASSIHEVIAHLISGHLDCEHPYLLARPVKRIGLIIVSTDRGLCGALNTNLFRLALEKINNWQQQQIAVDLCTIGNKAEVFFRRHKANIIACSPFVGEQPMAKAVIGPVKVMLDAYEANKLDQIYLVYNEFVTTMSQQPTMTKLLPVADCLTNNRKKIEYLYEPEPTMLLDAVLKRYLESLVYQSLVENAACEQSARMVAMRSASDNAGDLIAEFQLVYNKARQATITTELSEIVAGAAAV